MVEKLGTTKFRTDDKGLENFLDYIEEQGLEGIVQSSMLRGAATIRFRMQIIPKFWKKVVVPFVPTLRCRPGAWLVFLTTGFYRRTRPHGKRRRVAIELQTITFKSTSRSSAHGIPTGTYSSLDKFIAEYPIQANFVSSSEYSIKFTPKRGDRYVVSADVNTFTCCICGLKPPCVHVGYNS